MLTSVILFFSSECKLLLVRQCVDVGEGSGRWRFLRLEEAVVGPVDINSGSGARNFPEIDRSKLFRILNRETNYSNQLSTKPNDPREVTFYGYRTSPNELEGFSTATANQSSLIFGWFSATQFWNEIQSCSSRFDRDLLDLINTPDTQAAIIYFWSKTMSEKRNRIAERLYEVPGFENANSPDDSFVVNAILPRPFAPALEFDVNAVFAHGMKACPGAYRISEMTKAAEQVPLWRGKLIEPYQRYIEEEFPASLNET